MKKTVLVTGSDGYIGFPLTLKLVKDGHKVIGVDNLTRRQNVKLMGSDSAIKIHSPQERTEILKSIGNYRFFNYSTISSINMDALFLSFPPDTVINLAQQPSAPWSHKSQTHTLTTNTNNTNGVLNILYAMKKHAPNAHLIHIGTMGEYDPAVNVSIPEGIFKFWHKFRKSTNSLFPRRPGSFYHASKVASTYYIDLACRAWGLKATDIMQGIVFGNWTPESENHDTHTRLDVDEAFGTVLNRFILQAFLQQPLTIYGLGEHRRGFLSLYDSIQCLNIALLNPPKKSEYRTWNQLFLNFSINEVAAIVKDAAEYFNLFPDIKFIPSPRTETTSKHYYKPQTKILKDLGYIPECHDKEQVRNEIMYIFDILQKQDNIPTNTLKQAVQNPKIKWR